MNIGLSHHKVDLAEAEAAYARWASMVLRFCELFLGDSGLAEQVTTESFVRFLQGGQRAESNGVPASLVSVAFRVASQSPKRNGEQLEALRAAIVGLDAMPRAAFILHGVLSVQLPWVAAILGIPSREAAELWTKALVAIREQLPQDFFKERGR